MDSEIGCSVNLQRGPFAGPEGVKLLEFRHRTAFDTKFYEKHTARFRAKAEASLIEASTGSANSPL